MKYILGILLFIYLLPLMLYIQWVGVLNPDDGGER